MGMPTTHYSDADLADLQIKFGTAPTPRIKQKQPPAWWGHPVADLGEVAAELGLSRERVRQIEVEALRKLRAWCEQHGLTLEDLAR